MKGFGLKVLESVKSDKGKVLEVVRQERRDRAALKDVCCPQWMVVLVAGINSDKRGVVASSDPGDRSVSWDMGTIEEAGAAMLGDAWESLDWTIRFCPFCGKKKAVTEES